MGVGNRVGRGRGAAFRRVASRFAAMAATMLAVTPATAQAPVQAPATAPLTVSATIHGDRPGPVYNRRLFGQFAEHLGTGIYGGLWVGERSRIPNIRGYRRDVVDALRHIRVPVVRWPGGCFADEYNWREGIGPRARRPVKINTNWGGVTEDNAFGTHEFMDFAELIGAEAYVSGNVGSASPREMAEWVEYMTSPSGSSLATERARNGRAEPWKLPLFGLGNELWGCGGSMRPEYAANETRRYSTFVKAPSGVKIEKVASGASDFDVNWTEVMMRDAGRAFDAIGVHYYTLPDNWENKGPATGFDEAAWARTLHKTVQMDVLLTNHSRVMDRHDAGRRVAIFVDEWGSWYDQEPGSRPGFLYQQNSLRDAMIASLNLDIFARHAARVRGANIAQMANVLQAMMLTDGDRMVLTPTYHVFDLYKDYQDATVLPMDVSSPWYGVGEWTLRAVSGSAVRGADGVVHVGLTNVDPHRPATVTVRLAGIGGRGVTGRVLTGDAMDAHNSFDRPTRVRPAAFDGARIEGDMLTVTLPAKAIVMLDVR